jgi:hypothetical protein
MNMGEEEVEYCIPFKKIQKNFKAKGDILDIY